MEMVVIVKESDKAARADRHSHGTEIGSVESGAKPCHATRCSNRIELCYLIVYL